MNEAATKAFYLQHKISMYYDQGVVAGYFAVNMMALDELFTVKSMKFELKLICSFFRKFKFLNFKITTDTCKNNI